MTAKKRRIYLCWAGCHFILIFLAAASDFASIVAEGGNIFPPSLKPIWTRTAAVASALLGKRLSDANPARRVLTAYLHGTGIESGYGFFAPNVPNSYKLVFEIHYLDGRVEYELPQVAGEAAGLRVVSLLDNLGSIDYELMRRTTLNMLTVPVRQSHPDASMIRAVFGTVKLPRMEDYLRGEKESYEFLHAYDFAVPTRVAPSPAP